MLDYLIAIVLIYLYGSIPFSLFVGYLFGVDIRTVGSKNIGARNLARMCGPVAFLLGFLLDATKGMLAYIIAIFLGINPLVILVFAILGHCFSIFLKFKGGRGLSTTIGFALLYVTIPTIIAIIVFYICAKLLKYQALAALISTISFVIAGFFVLNPFDIALSIFALVCVVIAYHKPLIAVFKGNGDKDYWF